MWKVVSLAEIVKDRVQGLYQINKIGSQTFEEVYEPKEEGLDTLRFKKTIQFLAITLTKIEPEVKTYGFQLPINDSELIVYEPDPSRRVVQDTSSESGESGTSSDNSSSNLRQTRDSESDEMEERKSGEGVAHMEHRGLDRRGGERRGGDRRGGYDRGGDHRRSRPKYEVGEN